jgi:hypothetical protein
MKPTAYVRPWTCDGFAAVAELKALASWICRECDSVSTAGQAGVDRPAVVGSGHGVDQGDLVPGVGALDRPARPDELIGGRRIGDHGQLDRIFGHQLLGLHGEGVRFIGGGGRILGLGEELADLLRHLILGFCE